MRSKDPNSSYGYNFSELEVGRNRPYQVCRTFLKFNTLPKLEKGAVITDARLNLYQYQFSADDGKGFRVSAHEVTGAWDQRTLTWNNQPSFKTEALDYLTLENTNKMAVPKTFDVTKLIRGWYNNPSSNHGIALKAVNENVYATATLVSSDCLLYTSRLNNGNLVEVLGTQKGSDGAVWNMISIAGAYAGYVRADHLRRK